MSICCCTTLSVNDVCWTMVSVREVCLRITLIVRVVLFDYNTKVLWLDYFKCEYCVV